MFFFYLPLSVPPFYFEAWLHVVDRGLESRYLVPIPGIGNSVSEIRYRIMEYVGRTHTSHAYPY